MIFGTTAKSRIGSNHPESLHHFFCVKIAPLLPSLYKIRYSNGVGRKVVTLSADLHVQLSISGLVTVAAQMGY